MKHRSLEKILLIVVAAIAVMLFVYGNAAYADDKADSKVLARIGDKVITEADIAARIDAISPLYKATMDKEGGKKAFVEKMVYLYIYAQEARAEKIDQDKTVKMKLDDMANSVLAKEYLKKKGIVSPEVTKEEVEKFYREHEKDFMKGTSVKLSEILVKTDAGATDDQAKAAREKAQKITDEVKKGTDFAKLAMKYSDDEKTASKGGRLGYLTKEQMPPEVAKTAFSMKSGDTSDPIKTAQGFYVIKVEDKKEGTRESFDEAKKRIIPMLGRQKEKELVDKETKRLEKKYNVKIYLEDSEVKPAAAAEGKN
ncbi:MAG: peptidylprolyl isomerase [Deltaproteobacteria bacterium]|nr:peptidylprolyl isomerase [Deltaproteobacteria bacterium]